MELVWLEDFAELMATRHFSAAAAARNISQPAFSRRIKALEAWLGVELVDRRTSPVQLTASGRAFSPRCQELVNELYALRVECRHNAVSGSAALNFSAPHTIEMFFFPEWMAGLRQEIGVVQSHMLGGDHRDCVESLSLGNCDFALLWDCPRGPKVIRPGAHESVIVGQDRLIPVSARNPDGSPVYSLDPGGSHPIPFLGFSWKDGYLGRVASMLLAQQKTPLTLQTVYQSSLAEGIKRMAIAGMGIAWLPLSCARTAIQEGRLADIGTAETSVDMDVMLCRRTGQNSPAAEVFWKHMVEKALR